MFAFRICLYYSAAQGLHLKATNWRNAPFLKPWVVHCLMFCLVRLVLSACFLLPHKNMSGNPNRTCRLPMQNRERLEVEVSSKTLKIVKLFTAYINMKRSCIRVNMETAAKGNSSGLENYEKVSRKFANNAPSWKPLWKHRMIVQCYNCWIQWWSQSRTVKAVTNAFHDNILWLPFANEKLYGST